MTVPAPSTTLRVVPLPRFAGEDPASRPASTRILPLFTGEGDRRRRWRGHATRANLLATKIAAFIQTWTTIPYDPSISAIPTKIPRILSTPLHPRVSSSHRSCGNRFRTGDRLGGGDLPAWIRFPRLRGRRTGRRRNGGRECLSPAAEKPPVFIRKGVHRETGRAHDRHRTGGLRGA